MAHMQEIAERFPSLRGVLGVRPFDAVLLHDGIGVMSHGGQLAAQFVLNVWNQENPFNLGEARHVWDEQHRQAFLRFVLEDWWYAP